MPFHSQINSPWRDEALVARLIELKRDTRLSSAQISKILGVTRNAVIGKVTRMRLVGQPRPVPSPKAIMPPKPRSPQTSISYPSVTPPKPRAPKTSTSHPPISVPAERIFDGALSVELTDLAANGCRWPLGDPSTTDFRYCGFARSGHRVYCEFHADMGRRARNGAAKKPRYRPSGLSLRAGTV